MQKPSRRTAARVGTGLGVGALLGALYAALVGAVHLAVYGGFEGIPAFAAGCVLVGLALGLLGGVARAAAGEAGRGAAVDGSPPAGSRLPGGCAAGPAARPCCLSGVWPWPGGRP